MIIKYSFYVLLYSVSAILIGIGRGWLSWTIGNANSFGAS
mgnify:CR=1 FL=1